MSEIIPSSTAVCEKSAVKDKNEIESMFAKLFEESEKKSPHHDDEKEKMRRRHILEELQLDLERILKQRIDFGEGVELPTFDESYHTFETLAKKTTESMKTLASIVQMLISGYLSGSVEGVNIALGLNKLFQQALENYKVYMRRFETLIDRQMQNRKAYRDGLVDLHAAYVQESTELAKERNKSFDEKVEKAREIMDHNAFDVLKQNYNEMMKVMTFIK